MKINDLPVLLLTGYLGSGKTTLVNRILNNRRGIRFAVIVNDIGEVNIDADLIQKGGVVDKSDDSLVALQNGCICCTLKMDLVEQIHEITKTHNFDYLVIEASGICEPAPIAQTICSIPTLGPRYVLDGMAKLDCICTVVDALRLKDEFECGNDLMRKNIDDEDIENLVIQQIEFCNIVLLNKASQVEKHELAKIRQIIRALQPKAEIIECDYCDINLNKIVGTGMFNFDDVAGSAAWIGAVEGAVDEDDDEHHHHHHDEGEAEEYGIGTFVYYRRRPMELQLFDDFVARHWPKGVIRAKGICYFRTDKDMCYLFEQAGKQVSMSEAGQWYATMPENELHQLMRRDPTFRRDWDETYGDRMQKLVFIGQHLDKQAITAALDACLTDL